MKCSECKFWVEGRLPVPNDGRECRRYAPQPVNYQQLLAAAYAVNAADGNEHDSREAGPHWFDALVHWPLTTSDDFCGEFSPAKQVEFV